MPVEYQLKSAELWVQFQNEVQAPKSNDKYFELVSHFFLVEKNLQQYDSFDILYLLNKYLKYIKNHGKPESNSDNVLQIIRSCQTALTKACPQVESEHTLLLDVLRMTCMFAQKDTTLFLQMLMLFKQHTFQSNVDFRYQIDFYLFKHYYQLACRNFSDASQTLRDAVNIYSKYSKDVGLLQVLRRHYIRLRLVMLWQKMNYSPIFSTAWNDEVLVLCQQYRHIINYRIASLEPLQNTDSVISHLSLDLKLQIRLQVTLAILSGNFETIDEVMQESETCIDRFIAEQLIVPQEVKDEIISQYKKALTPFYLDNVPFTSEFYKNLSSPIMKLGHVISLATPRKSKVFQPAFEQYISLCTADELKTPHAFAEDKLPDELEQLIARCLKL